jgi:hypothetical protein
MTGKNLYFSVFCAALMTLALSPFPGQAGAQGLKVPGAFNKSTPINSSAYLSVWTLTLGWNASAGATGYEFCYDKSDDDTCATTWTPVGTNTSAEITSLEANTTYYWQVQANDGGSTAADGGNWWSFTTGGYARFHVVLLQNRVTGMDWRPGNSVTVSINDPTIPGIEFTDAKIVDSNGSVTFYDLGDLQVAPGMIVSMNDGTVFKSTTVTHLQVTGVDIDTDVVSGTGEVGAHLNIQYCQYNGCLWRRWTDVQPDGTWQVDFSVPGAGGDEQELLDLVPGTSGSALWPDDDADHTQVDWYFYKNFVVSPLEDRVEGTGWKLDATVTVSINAPDTPADPDHTGTTTVTAASWDESQTWFNLDFHGQYNLKPGDVVTVSDGITTKTHTVTNMKITDFDYAADTISGTAAPGSYINVWFYDAGYTIYRTELADSSGRWTADFAGSGDRPWEDISFDLLPGINGNLHQLDADNDATAIRWTAVNSLFLPLIRR